MARQISDTILNPLIEMVEQFGFKWWVSTDQLCEVSLVVDCPEVWLNRVPTDKELGRFYELWQRGMIDEAREFAQVGLPEHQR